MNRQEEDQEVGAEYLQPPDYVRTPPMHFLPLGLGLSTEQLPLVEGKKKLERGSDASVSLAQ